MPICLSDGCYLPRPAAVGQAVASCPELEPSAENTLQLGGSMLGSDLLPLPVKGG